MRRATIGILCVSAAIGLGTALVPPIVNDRDCHARLATWTSELANASLDRPSGDAALPLTKKAQGEPPLCRKSQDSFNFAILGLTLFLTVFTGSYACWLFVRACKTAMRRLTSGSARSKAHCDLRVVLWSTRATEHTHYGAQGFERRSITLKVQPCRFPHRRG
jgi:hypothetical protein